MTMHQPDRRPARPDGAPRGAADLFQLPPLGDELGLLRARLMGDIEILAEMTDGSLRQRVVALRSRVRGAALKISVIGQMKSGKSALLNAMMRRAGLLPTDVNPATTVVTRLNFGHGSGKTSGAVFRFFSEADWDRLASRGGRLGELSADLLEPYKRQELSAQVAAMKERAQARLGDSFHTLLGKAHRFDTMTPAVLARYVTAGDEADPRAQNATTGKYADITHSAELYFDQEPFGHPVCLIDTPGVNDPLLIREEITQQSIENSDHFVIVLSAHQSLTKVDMRLVRLLKALDRDRFVVFVNRLDEIRDPAGEYPRVRDRILANLTRELGGREVGVVLGSAGWADFALTGNDQFLDRRALSEFVARRGIGPEARKLDPANALGDPARAEAYAASGLTELMARISDLVRQGPVAAGLAQASAELLALAGQAEETARLRLAVADAVVTNYRPVVAEPEASAAVRAVGHRATETALALRGVVEEAFAEIADDMSATVRGFADTLGTALKLELARTARGQAVSCDLDPLRADLRDVYEMRFKTLRARLGHDLAAFETAARTLFPEAAKERLGAVRLQTGAVTTLHPEIDGLFRTVALDLTGSGWFSNILGGSNAKIAIAVVAMRRQFEEICRDIATNGKAQIMEALDRAIEDFRSDAGRQMMLLAGITTQGDVYDEGSVEDRHDQRERAEITAEVAADVLRSAADTHRTVADWTFPA